MEALVIPPTAAGTLIAAAAIAAGAPLFSDGLRTLRLRRHFARLREKSLASVPSGVTHVRGRVALESPLFAPLSGRPCAGFRLEVSSPRTPGGHAVEVRRPFRVTDGVVSARVQGDAGRWEVATSAEREVGPEDALSENVASLLGRVPEARWLRRAGLPLRLVEHALCAGATCHVVGFARHQRTLERQAEAEIEHELERTGTDAVAALAGAPAPAAAATTAGEPDFWIGPGEHLDFLLVSDAAPRPERLHLAAARLVGLALGPALSLAGMLYLAHAADWLRVHGGF
jgi:hypothetical protein